MPIWRSVILNVVKQSVGYFEDGLVGNVLIGLNAELDALEAFGQLVLKLLLDRTLGRVNHVAVYAVARRSDAKREWSRVLSILVEVGVV